MRATGGRLRADVCVCVCVSVGEAGERDSVRGIDCVENTNNLSICFADYASARARDSE